MEIPFRYQFDSMRYAFIMTFEPEQITAAQDGDTPRLNIPARFKRVPLDNDQPQGLYPVVLELHGRLTRANQPFELGATLLPLEDMPISMILPYSQYYVNLSFAFSVRYLQLLEEQRASHTGQNMSLALRMWGVAAMVMPRANAQGVPNSLHPPSVEVFRFEKVFTESSLQALQIERSAWVDRILPGLDYRRSVLIELPLIRTPAVPEAYQKAAEALDVARCAFDQEDYRGAIKHAREVLEHLGKSSSDGSGKLTSFCKEYLEPFVGETKSNAVERSLNALREVTNASSHIDPQKPFVVNRAIAVYVIETLALNLRYISSVLG